MRRPRLLPDRSHLRWLAVALLPLWTIACSDATAPTPVDSVGLSQTTVELVVGTTRQLSATPRAANGNELARRPVTWSSNAAGVASVSATGLITAVAPGSATVTATSESATATVAVTVVPVPVATVNVTPATATIRVTETQQLVATPRDAANNSLSGRTTAWSSSDTSRAVVSDAGLVTARAEGPVTITATVEGRSGTATLTVLGPPVATVTVSPASADLRIGAAQQLTAELLDADGNVLTGRDIAWSSANAARATVSATGLVTGVSIGTVNITATSEGRSAIATLTVIPAEGAPSITAIAPGSLVPGSTATITGTDFSATLGLNSVQIGGAVAQVTAATPTQLTVVVPCTRGGSQAVQVTVNGLAGLPVDHPVATPQRTLAVGEAAIVTEAATSRCNEVVFGGAAGRYVVTVYSVAEGPNILTDFRLSGNPATASEPVAELRAPAPRTLRQPSAAERAQAEMDRRHHERLEENNRILAALGHTARQMPSASLIAAEVPALGARRELNYWAGGGCTGPAARIVVRSRYVGSRAIIWEDSANTLQSANNATYAAALQRIGQLYDSEMHDVLVANFGDPLRRDVDADGRIHMVFTERVNGFAAAFVTTCDQFPTSTAPTSNVGEFFYASVPTNPVLNLNATTSPDGWLSFMMRTVIHEVKHIASVAARVANFAPTYEVSWLEEATARHSEEMWYRTHISPSAWRGNAGWGSAASNGVYCDFVLTDATCTAQDALRRPNWGVRRHFNELRPRLIEPWNWSPFGDGTGQSGSIFYQTGWSLVRYAIDRYGSSDAQFLTALNSSTTAGVTNLAGRAGVSLAQLLGGWGLAMYADDYPGLSSPSADIDFPTWNLRSIYAGLNVTPGWNTIFTSPFLLQPVSLPSRSFSTTLSGVRGGGHAYFEFVGSPGDAQLLNLTALDGGTASTNLRIAIARLQ